MYGRSIENILTLILKCSSFILFSFKFFLSSFFLFFSRGHTNGRIFHFLPLLLYSYAIYSVSDLNCGLILTPPKQGWTLWLVVTVAVVVLFTPFFSFNGSTSTKKMVPLDAPKIDTKKSTSCNERYHLRAIKLSVLDMTWPNLLSCFTQKLFLLMARANLFWNYIWITFLTNLNSI